MIQEKVQIYPKFPTNNLVAYFKLNNKLKYRQHFPVKI